eukprot:TRINITY_DN893_c0_g3_i1.p1 TRINITY_DN893_c0_g3~~TRINITY_DN893_c0_g3_i1.p1  ORF type:complete len:649 (-),score=137.48 TRINITY_DN893_c0_g3_i1:64-2010(-)
MNSSEEGDDDIRVNVGELAPSDSPRVILGDNSCINSTSEERLVSSMPPPDELQQAFQFVKKKLRPPDDWRQFRRNLLLNAFPVLKWLPHYNYKECLLADIIGGLTSGTLSVPQGLAYATIAHLEPKFGLYAAAYPAFVYFIFGSSPHLIIGPTAVMSLLIGALSVNQNDIFVISFIVGMIQMIASLTRIGFLANLLSHSVIVGFTTAAAIIIITSQFKAVFNSSAISTSTVFSSISTLFKQMFTAGGVNWWCFFMSFAAIIILLLLKRTKRLPFWFPGALLITIIGTVLSYLLKLEDHGFSIVGDVEAGWEPPQAISFDDFGRLLPNSFLIALIGFIEAISVGKTFAIQHNYDLGANEELYGLGWTNMVGAFFQAYPSTGSFSRTAVNANSGAKTGLSNLIAAVLVLLVILFMTSAFYYLPTGILGSVVIVAAIGLIDTKMIVFMWRSRKVDFFMAFCAFWLTIILGIEYGIASAFILSMVLVVISSTIPNHSVLQYPINVTSGVKQELIEEYDAIHAQTINQEAIVWRINDSIYFANKHFFKETVSALCNLVFTPTRSEHNLYFVLDGSSVNFIDTDGMHAVKETVEQLQKKNITTLFVGLKPQPYATLERSGLLAELGKDNFFDDIKTAMAFLRLADTIAEREKDL